MNKKLGNIISAIVLSLSWLFFARLVFGQTNCPTIAVYAGGANPGTWTISGTQIILHPELVGGEYNTDIYFTLDGEMVNTPFTVIASNYTAGDGNTSFRIWGEGYVGLWSSADAPPTGQKFNGAAITVRSATTATITLNLDICNSSTVVSCENITLEPSGIYHGAITDISGDEVTFVTEYDFTAAEYRIDFSTADDVDLRFLSGDGFTPIDGGPVVRVWATGREDPISSGNVIPTGVITGNMFTIVSSTPSTVTIRINTIGCLGGGGITCTTVTDADFTELIPYEAGGWNMWNDNVSMHGGYLDISTEYGVPQTWQVFTPTNRTYTATLKARSASTQTTTAEIAITSNNFDGEFVVVPIEETAADEFGTYRFVLSNTVAPGEEAYLFINTGPTGLQVDYICLEEEEGACPDPIETEYVYAPDPNNLENGLNEWTLDKDNEFSLLPDYGNITVLGGDSSNGGYAQKLSELSPDEIETIIVGFASVYKVDVRGVWEGLKTMFVDPRKVDSITLKMPNRASLESISVDVYRNNRTDVVDITVLADVDGEWEIVGHTLSQFDFALLGWSSETIEIPLQPVNTPTEYMLISTITGRTTSFDLIAQPYNYITKISAYGCFSGMAYSGACIVSDPELDTGEDGGPDRYYWYWSPSAPVISGSVTLAADGQTELSQNVFARTPGRYRLTIGMDSASADGCELSATGMNPDRTERFWSVLIPCAEGVISQTVLAEVTLPAEPFKFILESNSGVNVIKSVCFGAPGSGCINMNSDFSNGLVNYSGGEQVAGGVLLAPGKGLQAIGVPYFDHLQYPGPYILTVNANIFTNTNVTTGSVNTYILPPSAIAASPSVSDTHFTVAGATVLSYTMPVHPQSDFGPTVVNWDDAAGQSLKLTSYCISTSTNKLWYGDKSCSTVTNPDFLEGLNGWTNSNVYDAMGYVKFASGGYVKQTVNPLNLITNPGFEVNTTGWTEYDPNGVVALTRSTAEYKIGSASGKIARTGNNPASIYYYSYSPPGTYTFGVWVKTNGKYKLLISKTDGTTDYSTMYTGDGSWQFRTFSRSSTTGTNRVQGGLYFDANTTGTDDVYIDGAVLVAGSSIPLPYTTPQSTTLHWIGKAPDNLPTSATATISSTSGVFTVSHTFGNSYIPDEFFDKFNIGGDVDIQITSDPLFELDYVCLLTGDYDGPGDDGDGPDGGPDDMGEWSEACGAPPVLIITNTLSSWIPSIWPNLTAPDNLTALTAYTAMNVRYIACFITGWAQLGMYKTDQIIALLQQIRDQLLVGNILSALGILVLIISMMLGSTGEVIETIGSLAGLLGSGAGSLASLLLIVPALIALVMLIVMLVSVLFAIGPVFFRTFGAALVGTDGMTLIPDTANQQVLGYIIAGMQIFDQAAGQTYLMPFVALVVSVGTIGLLIWTINKISNWTT